jgi:hypothetical protein
MKDTSYLTQLGGAPVVCVLPESVILSEQNGCFAAHNKSSLTYPSPPNAALFVGPFKLALMPT